MSVQCAPPSVDLYTPSPGSIVLREFGSPVPAHTTFVSDGAIANMPNAATSLSSKIGRQVTPLFVDFQSPPPAAATYSVLDGPAIPCTSETRPLKLAGPTFRQRNAETIELSRACAKAEVVTPSASATPQTAVMKRDGCMSNYAGWETNCRPRQYSYDAENASVDAVFAHADC